MDFLGINIPLTWTGVRPRIDENCKKLNIQLQDAIKDGYKVTHITSSTVNDVMYAYHFLEKEEK